MAALESFAGGGVVLAELARAAVPDHAPADLPTTEPTSAVFCGRHGLEIAVCSSASRQPELNDDAQFANRSVNNHRRGGYSELVNFIRSSQSVKWMNTISLLAQ